MGTPPQPAGPAPTAGGPSVDFPPSPSAQDLCGFKFPPGLNFTLGFSLPTGGIAFPPKIQLPHLGLALNCQSSNPLAVNANVPYGGGRKPNAPPDPDLLEQGQS